jgi:hypothetical protein
VIGPRTGVRCGLVGGSRNGSGVDELGGGAAAIIAATKDATSGKYIPQSAAEWTAVMTAAGLATGNPSSTWLLQMASGDATDSIGSITLTAANAPSYRTTVPGWSTKAVSWTDGSASQFINSTTAPNPGSVSIGLLVYSYATATPATKRYFAVISNLFIDLAIDASGHSVVDDSGSGTSTEVTTDGAVRAHFLVLNIAASTCKLYTPHEVISTGFYNGAGAGITTSLGSSAGTPAGGILYAAQFAGSAAALADADVRKILTTLGWSVAW